MSDTVIYNRVAAGLGNIPQDCQVLILSEDFPAYGRAIQACRRIMDQCGMDWDFDFRCWNLVELVDPGCAHTAAKYASMADIILVSTNRTSLAPNLCEWLDGLHAIRSEVHGAFLLMLNQIAPQPDMDKLVARMERIAARLAMDFVPHLPIPADLAWRSQPAENWAFLSPSPERAIPVVNP